MNNTQKPINLTLYFSIFAALSILLVTIGTSWSLTRFTTNILLTLGQEEAQQIGGYLSSQLSQDVLQPVFASENRGQMSSEQQTHIANTVVAATVGLNVIRADFHRADGTLIFSTDPEVNANSTVVTDIAEAVQTGQLVSKLEEAGEIDSQSGKAWTIDVLETYVPYRFSSDGEVVGVFEIYQDVDALTSQITTNQRQIALIITAFMAALFIGLFFIVHYADQLISRQQKQLTAQNEELLALQQMKDDLTHMLVHDLKQPLTTIRGSVDMLNRQITRVSDDSRIVGMIELANRSSQKLLDMINELLDITRLQEGRLPLTLQVISADQFLGDLVTQAQGRAETESKHLFFELSDPPPLIQIDKGLMTRVMSNLIDNAFKYTPHEGGISVLVKDTKDQKVQIRVIDQGPGIPLEWRERIFQRFTQVNDGERKSKAGTGLGLTFCRMVVEAHQGKIWVEDAPSDIGSQFVIVLPNVLSEV